MADEHLWLLDDAPILGGAERFALRLAESVRDDVGVRLTIVSPDSGPLAVRCRAAAVAVEALEFPRSPARVAGALVALRRLLAGRARDAIVVANTARTQAYAAVAGRGLGTRVVNLIHERDTARRRSARIVLPRSGAMVCVGERVAAAYRAAIPGIDPATVNIFLTPSELAPAGARRRREQSGPPDVGVLGRLIPEKGVAELVDELHAHPGSWGRLLIAAPPQDPAYARLVADRIRAHGAERRVELLGYVEDLDSFFARIDLHVVPSVGNEGQVFGVLEGLARDVPSIVRRSVLSPEYEGLPVAGYDGADELARRLERPPAEPVDRRLLERRFGSEQAVTTIVAAARG